MKRFAQEGKTLELCESSVTFCCRQALASAMPVALPEISISVPSVEPQLEKAFAPPSTENSRPG